MFFRWLRGSAQTSERPSANEALRKLVAEVLPSADGESVALIGAIAGLLAHVAYADRAYHEEEQLAVEDALRRIEGLEQQAVGAISGLLRTHIAELASETVHEYTRVLFELAERSARLELLDVLMDLAAADLVLSMEETNLIRRISKLLGLSDQDYLASQERHRSRLSVLGRKPD
jgi:uncharacterized tellurite resistance protein B-like protein